MRYYAILWADVIANNLEGLYNIIGYSAKSLC